jgi:hypothetical protein
MLGSLRIFRDRDAVGKAGEVVEDAFNKVWWRRQASNFRISDTFKCGTVRPPLLPERQGPQIPLHRYAVTG